MLNALTISNDRHDHPPFPRLGLREGPHPADRIHRGAAPAEAILSLGEIHVSLPGEVPNNAGRDNPLKQFARHVQQTDQTVVRRSVLRPTLLLQEDKPGFLPRPQEPATPEAFREELLPPPNASAANA